MKLGKCVHDKLSLNDTALFGELSIDGSAFYEIFILLWRIINDVFDY